MQRSPAPAIGLVTAAGRQRTPIVAELMTMFAPFELDDVSPGPQRMRRPMSSTP